MRDAIRSDQSERAIAFRLQGEPPDIEDPQLEVEGRQLSIAYAVSELAMRSRLLEHGHDVVLLTPLRNSDIGDDLKARLRDNGIQNLDIWEAVRALFGAGEADPALICMRAVGQYLLEHASGTFEPTPTGRLTTNDVMSAVLETLTGERRADWTAESLMMAFDRPPTRRALHELPEPVEATLANWLIGRHGQELPALLAAVRHQDMSPVAFGVIVEIVLTAQHTGEQRNDVALVSEASTLAERLGVNAIRDSLASLDLVHPDDALTRFGAMAGGVYEATFRDVHRHESVGAVGTRHERFNSWRASVEASFGQTIAAAVAASSRFTNAGWKARLEVAYEALKRLLESGDAARETAREAKRELDDHLFAMDPARRPDRDRIHMALRLALSIHRTDGEGVADHALASRYVERWSLEDQAREYLLHPVGNPIHQDLLRTLREQLIARSDARNRRFAQWVAQHLERGETPPEVLSVEAFLGQVARPLALSHPLLIVVLDGMSWAVARHLLIDADRSGWRAWIPADQGSVRPMLSTVPSVTSIARTTLLSGTLQQGGAPQERSAFEGYDFGRGRARLFHKSDLRSEPFHRDVLPAIDSDMVRVVGVVINAIDEQLSGAAQGAFPWRLQRIHPLAALMERAGDNGRLVIWVSDHGHILDDEATEGSAAAGLAQRYRAAGPPPEEGELEVRGPAVVRSLGAPSVVVPWTERLRYSRGARGYHGGVTLQELVAPLVVLGALNVELSEERFAPYLPHTAAAQPAWWDLEVASEVTGTTTPQLASRVYEPPALEEPGEQRPQLELPLSTPAEPRWRRVFRSPVYRQQRLIPSARLLRRADVEALLGLLSDRDGRAALREVAEQLGVTPGFAQRRATALQALLNVEGTRVVELDRRDGFVRLDFDKLYEVFGLNGR